MTPAPIKCLTFKFSKLLQINDFFLSVPVGGSIALHGSTRLVDLSIGRSISLEQVTPAKYIENVYIILNT